jgi:hypothetical protein
MIRNLFEQGSYGRRLERLRRALPGRDRLPPVVDGPRVDASRIAHEVAPFIVPGRHRNRKLTLEYDPTQRNPERCKNPTGRIKTTVT